MTIEVTKMQNNISTKKALKNNKTETRRDLSIQKSINRILIHNGSIAHLLIKQSL